MCRGGLKRHRWHNLSDRIVNYQPLIKTGYFYGVLGEIMAVMGFSRMRIN
jgi:hypothetical protein